MEPESDPACFPWRAAFRQEELGRPTKRLPRLFVKTHREMDGVRWRLWMREYTAAPSWVSVVWG